jgi:3-dehydroquinate synthase
MERQLEKHNIFFNTEAIQSLENILSNKVISKIAILCDENTHEHCVPLFLSQVAGLDTSKLEIIELEVGEDNKSIEVLAQLWDSFGALGLDRSSLLLNLGGGVISDLGGFAAGTYMRGFDFINFPTSLLAMVDASVGAKTGINFAGFKNRIGLFADPLMVGVIPGFLETLPQIEFLSGWAEMLKHGLIADANHWQTLLSTEPKTVGQEEDLIAQSIAIKAKVVEADKREVGLRKILNFGHTIGHALESYYLKAGHPITHGHAVALGMQVELSLSAAFAEMDPNEALSLREKLAHWYKFPKVQILEDEIRPLLLGDKKNNDGNLRLSLLKTAGQAVFDIELPQSALLEHLQKCLNV